jgi:hypothetical protein
MGEKPCKSKVRFKATVTPPAESIPDKIEDLAVTHYWPYRKATLRGTCICLKTGKVNDIDMKSPLRETSNAIS